MERQYPKNNYGLKCESHERRVQRDRKEQVRSANHCHGQDGDEISDFPVVGDERADSKNDHTSNAEDTEGDRVLEALEDPGNFNEEVGELGFLGGGTPLHVVLEHVSEESGGDVQRKTTEECSHHQDPLDVLEERGEETLVTDTVAHDGERQVTKTSENNDDGEPDLP